jgi:hypothetical protein
MRSRDNSLLAQIEAAALDEEHSVAGALRKCVALGGQAGSSELRDWATKELRGYDNDDELPEYRIVAAPILIDGVTFTAKITGQQIAPSSLPDFVQETIGERFEFRSGVGEVEELVRSCERSGEPAKLQLPGGSEVARLMTQESGDSSQSILAIYWSISPVAIRGVTDQVRTSLVQLVAELRAGMPDDQSLPSAEAAAHAVQVAVTGKRSNVTVTAAQAGNGGQANVTANEPAPPESGFWTRSRRIGAFFVGAATVVGAVIAVIEFL